MEGMQEFFGWLATGLTICGFISPIFPYLNVLRGRLSFEETPAVLVTTIKKPSHMKEILLMIKLNIVM